MIPRKETLHWQGVVQRAAARGLVVVSVERQGPGWREVAKARSRAHTRKLRAQRCAAGQAVATGRPLVRQRHPELRGLSQRDYRRLYSAKRRAALAALGLNTLGQPIRPRRTAEEVRAARRASNLRCNRRWRAKLVRQGLTATGTPRRNRQHPDLSGLRGRAYLKAWRAKRKAAQA